jgi:preprotein translocase subunit Sss1
MHSFPSTGDAKSIWAAVMRPGVNTFYKIITVPLVGLLYLGAIGSVFWLDVIYGVGVIMALPTVLFG